MKGSLDDGPTLPRRTRDAPRARPVHTGDHPMGPMNIDLTGSGMLSITRDALTALRAALMRDTGPAAAGYLQEAGYAGGGALFEAFRQWLASQCAVPAQTQTWVWFHLHETQALPPPCSGFLTLC